MISLKNLKPYEKNPRKNDASVDKVAESIRQFGFKVPIVIDRGGVIVTGHTRYKAAKKLKLPEVPCIRADDLTEEQVKAFRLADNKVGEGSEWDLDLLTDELDSILDIDMTEFGFDDLSDEKNTVEEDDDHQPCLYGWRDGARHYWFKNRRQTTVLQFDKPSRSAEHPTMKPIKLFDYEMQCNSKPGEIVLDLFGGSGTTIMAAEQNGRCGYVMEFDPRFVDVIIARWEDFTGEKAELISEN
jgi:hypothetical protein